MTLIPVCLTGIQKTRSCKIQMVCSWGGKDQGIGRNQKTTQSLLHGGNEIPDPHHRNISDVANSSLRSTLQGIRGCLGL